MSVVHMSRVRIDKHEGPHRTAQVENFADPIHFGIISQPSAAKAFGGSRPESGAAVAIAPRLRTLRTHVPSGVELFREVRLHHGRTAP